MRRAIATWLRGLANRLYPVIGDDVPCGQPFTLVQIQREIAAEIAAQGDRLPRRPTTFARRLRSVR